MRGYLAPLASAVLIVLAAPPFDLWPLALVSLIPLYLAVRNVAPVRAALLGWLTGFAALLGGTYWWADVLGRFAGLSLPAGIALTVLFCGYQALAFAVWAGVTRLLAQRCRLSWLVAGPLVMALSEFMVPFFFKMYLAITVWRAWPLTQVAEIGGPPAVSALLVLINLVLAELGLAFVNRQQPGAATKRGAAAIAVILVLGLLRAGYVGYVRQGAEALKVGILQPNFGIVAAQERERHGKRYIKTLRQATLALSRQGVDLIIWPETSWPYLFDREISHEYPAGHPWELRPGAKNGRLLFGSLTHTFGTTKVYNSALLLSDSGKIAGRYDKMQLVPFGEYIPFADRYPVWAEEVREKTPDWPDIEKGKEPRLLVDGNVRIGSLICSEDLDMRYVHQVAGKKPNLLASIASDAWFGDSGGAKQHLALAVFRAIETRRDLVRGTNTGVSAIIDALGRVRLQGPLLSVANNEPRPPTLLTGEVKLSNIFALAPYSVRFFPLASLLTLVVLFKCQAKREP